MADKRNGKTEYNWSYSGDDAQNYRSKYTQGFDPDYVNHTAERAEQQEDAGRIRREQAGRPQRTRPSARRARLTAQQEVRTERRTERRVADAEEVRSNRQVRENTERRTARQDTEGQQTARSKKQQQIRQSTVRRQGQRSSSTQSRSRSRTAAASRRKQSAAYRRQIMRRRYLLLGLAAVAGIFLILFLANTYSLTITLTGDDPQYLELGETWKDPGAVAVYKGSLLHFGDTEVPVVSEQEINNRACGTYEVSYHAEHGDLQATATRMVIIPDRTPPVLTLDNSVDVVRRGDEWKDSFTAVDDQDGDITANVEVLGEVNMRRDGKYDLTYRVWDSAGNEATATRTVIVSSVAINRPDTARQGDKNVIYLTFDDGPGMYTERLLDILDSHNVKATFFVTDTNPGSRDLIGEEYRRGHTIGVHSLTHDYDIIYENGTAFWEDLDQEMEIIREQTGSDTTFMRFPGGSSNDFITSNVELEKTLAAGVKERGLRYYDWTIDSYDSNDEYTSDDVYWNMVDQASVSDTKMVLCHDMKLTTIEAIDSFLTWAIENHYVFLPITEETPEVHHIEIE